MTAVDLTKLPAPPVLETLDYDDVFAEVKALFLGEFSTDEVEAARLGVPTRAKVDLLFGIEGNLIVKILQAYAYHATQVRARVNDAAKATMLAYAVGADLDNLAGFYGVVRKADETDEALRSRTVLAVDAISTAGPVAAYKFHALSAADNVKDVAVESPEFEMHTPASGIAAQLPDGAVVYIPTDNAGLADPRPGDVAVTVLSRVGTGVADEAMIAAVNTALSAEDVRPLTDRVTVRSAAVQSYAVAATVWTYPGVDSATVVRDATEAVDDHVTALHKIGYDIPISGIIAAATIPGVQRVVVSQPANRIVINARQAAYCTGVTITHGGTDV